MGFVDWRGQNEPAARSQERPRQAQIEEEESDEGEEDEEGCRQFVWDAAKGELVEAKKLKAQADKPEPSAAPSEAAALPSAEGQAPAASGTAPADAGEASAGAAEVAAGATGQAQAGEEAAAEAAEDSSDGDDSSEQEDVEATSRDAFLSSASTPELIKQAVAVGGAMADGVRDRWVLDKETKLYFRHDGATQKMHCWNPDQGCMYLWKERGKMDFLWASSSGPQATPPPEAAAPPGDTPSAPAPAATAAPAEAAVASLWVTVIPPQALVAGGVAEPDDRVSEELEFSAKAFAHVVGKGGAGIKELEKRFGVTAVEQEKAEGDTWRRLQLEGTRAQIADAKAMLDQKVVMGIGERQAERMQKHVSSELLARKRAETGTEAAKTGVSGLSAFCETWGIQAVMARKLARMDAMLQRYLIRHFKPWKAKPANALRGYLSALLKQPQRWRLEALCEDGELDGEVCETVVVNHETGAVIGRQSKAFGSEGDIGSQQLIELEVNEALGDREAAKTYGDVQPQHCRLMRMGRDYYAWAVESQIGSVVDGHKYREHDGPVPLRDGSVLGVGKYLLYCEVGEAGFLQLRRQKLLKGERFWKLDSETLKGEQEAKGQEEEPSTVQGADSSASGEEEDEAPAAGEDGSRSSRKRKREAGEVAEAAEEGADAKAAEELVGEDEEDDDDAEEFLQSLKDAMDAEQALGRG